jgi:hypothetical protein
MKAVALHVRKCSPKPFCPVLRWLTQEVLQTTFHSSIGGSFPDSAKETQRHPAAHLHFNLVNKERCQETLFAVGHLLLPWDGGVDRGAGAMEVVFTRVSPTSCPLRDCLQE